MLIKKIHLKTAVAGTFLGLAFFTASAQQDTAKPIFKPGFKVTAQVFGDYFYKVASDSLGRGSTQYSKVATGFNAFSLRRVYLGVAYDLSEKFTAETVLAQESSSDIPGSARPLIVKFAFLRWKNIYKGAELVIGQQQTPTFALLSEKVWGYRPIEKTITDMRKIASSTDLGVGLQAKFGKDMQYGYNVMLGNNNATAQEADNSKRLYVSLYGKFLKHLLVEGYTDYEQAIHKKYLMSKMTPKIFVAWQTDPLTIGVEAFQQMQTNPFGDSTKAKPMGISAFVGGTLMKDKLSAFVRYDSYDPDAEKTNSGIRENFMTAGLDYMPMKNVHLMPNVWHNGYSNKNPNAKGTAKSGQDVAARVTFLYVFK